MNVNAKRLLIVGAGVVGSIYALRFAQSGLDVTVLARGKRLDSLRRDGLRYHDNGTIRQIAIRTIEKLGNDDVYDFIFVPVRFDQAESALAAIKDNRSRTIVTLTNTVGYDSWLDIVGDRLLPGFPGAGGDMKDGVLYAQFGSAKHQGTLFGEIDGQPSDRVKELASLLEAANLHYEVQENILAFHVAHAAVAVANKHFYTQDGIMDPETARSDRTLSKLAAEIKENLRLVEQSGIPIVPRETNALGDLPEEEIVAMYRKMLSDDFIIDVMLGDHTVSQRAEIELLDEALRKKLSAVER